MSQAGATSVYGTSMSEQFHKTHWPNSLPDPNEEYFFSVSGDDVKLSWAFHDVKNNMDVSLLWRCPLLNKDDVYNPELTMSDRMNFLVAHLPPVTADKGTTNEISGRNQPHDYIFGAKCPPTLESAAKKAVERRAHVTVYVLSTDSLQVELISKLFRCIPSRVFAMKSSDFFKHRNQNVSIDRMAALCGSAHLQGFPSLILSANDELTYTAADAKGNLLGGGISPGLALRLKSMSENSDQKEIITEKNLYGRLETVSNKKKPLQIFSNSYEDSIITAALSEISNNARYVIQLWLEKVGSANKHSTRPNTNSGPINDTRVVSVIGKNAAILNKLMKANHGGMIESSNASSVKDVNTQIYDKLIPFGIQHVINRESTARNVYLDTRVAKKILVPGEGVVILRGTVGAPKHLRSGHPFSVAFDDGTSMDYPLSMIIEMTKLFKVEGKISKETNQMASPSKRNLTKIAPLSQRKSARSPSISQKKKRFLKDEIEEVEMKKHKNDTKDPRSYIHMKVGKYFDADLFFGTVTNYTKAQNGLWHVKYEDGDEEDYDKKELEEGLRLHAGARKKN